MSKQVGYLRGVTKPPSKAAILYKLARKYPSMAAGTALHCTLAICAGFYWVTGDLELAMVAAARERAEKLIYRYGGSARAISPNPRAIDFILTHWANAKNEVRASELIALLHRQAHNTQDSVTLPPALEPAQTVGTLLKPLKNPASE